MTHGRVQECTENNCDGVSYCGGGTILKCHKCGESYDFTSRRSMMSNTKYIEIDDWNSLSDFFSQEVDSNTSYQNFKDKHSNLFETGG